MTIFDLKIRFSVNFPPRGLILRSLFFSPVIEVPDFSGKFLWFFLYKILEFVYPPLWSGGFNENP